MHLAPYLKDLQLFDAHLISEAIVVEDSQRGLMPESNV